jgi:hypothetical protein
MNARNQRGFSMMLIGGIAIAVVIGGLGLAVKVQSARLESCKEEYAAFVSRTQRLGEEAQKWADDEKARFEKERKDADTLIVKLQRNLAATQQRLRDERARSNLVPPASATSRSPRLACFDRPELERALSNFVEAVAGLLAEGDARTAELDTAKTWVRGVIKPAP